MPDRERKSISATQSPALFNASPWLTPFMLQQALRGTGPVGAATPRMEWGIALQPLILQKVKEDLNLEIEPNFTDTYRRRIDVPIGCTVDAEANDPTRGRGVVEVKCVFDYGTWMRTWNGGRNPPRHYEIQLQHQMCVGDGTGAYNWGVIAVWVCAEMHYFQRELLDDFAAELNRRATDFMANLDKDIDPIGISIEAALVQELWPTVRGNFQFDNSEELDDLARLFFTAREAKTKWNTAADSYRAKLLAAAKGAEKIVTKNFEVTIRAVNKREYNVKSHTETHVSVSHRDALEEILEADQTSNPGGT